MRRRVVCKNQVYDSKVKVKWPIQGFACSGYNVYIHERVMNYIGSFDHLDETACRGRDPKVKGLVCPAHNIYINGRIMKKIGTFINLHGTACRVVQDPGP